jgi:hypothetical protein
MIKIKKRYFLLTGIIIITAIVVFILLPRGKPVKVLNTDTLYSVVKEGDIICRLGDRFWSDLFKDTSITDKRYSHMGIIHIKNDQIFVIHSEGTTEPGRDYVKEEPINDFIKIARTIGIYRLNEIDGDKIASCALQYTGLPFDWKFDLQDDSQIYCTELLYHVLKQIMPNLELKTTYVKEMGREIIPLDAISNSGHFSEIYFLH